MEIPSPTPVASTLTRISLSGEQLRLPHKNTDGMQTMECAFGLKTDDGKYYALNFGQGPDATASFSTGKRLTTSGTFTPVETLSAVPCQNYPVIGILTVLTKK